MYWQRTPCAGHEPDTGPKTTLVSCGPAGTDPGTLLTPHTSCSTACMYRTALYTVTTMRVFYEFVTPNNTAAAYSGRNTTHSTTMTFSRSVYRYIPRANYDLLAAPRRNRISCKHRDLLDDTTLYTCVSVPNERVICAVRIIILFYTLHAGADPLLIFVCTVSAVCIRIRLGGKLPCVLTRFLHSAAYRKGGRVTWR